MTNKRSEQDLNPSLGAVEFGVAVLQEIVKKHDAAQETLDKRADELKPEALEAFRDETRREFGEKAAAAFSKHIERHQNLPAEQKALYDPAELRRTARFNADDATDAQMSLAFQGRLAIAPNQRLLGLAEDIAAKGDFARAGLLEDFVASRGDSIPTDVRGAVERALAEMKYSGHEMKLLDELENLVFEAEQAVNEVKLGARRFTTAQLEAMSPQQYRAAREAQKRAGIEQ